MSAIKPQILSSFSYETQEEVLDIPFKSKPLLIGIPKERAFQENRIALIPEAVSVLVANGHEVVLEAMAKADIFAYPCSFSEVTCMPLVEAMSAKAICIHPMGGVLQETCLNLTFNYEAGKFHKDHVDIFSKQVQIAIDAIKRGNTEIFQLEKQKEEVDKKHNWDTVIEQWKTLIDA